MTTEQALVLEARGITKRCPVGLANDSVDFTLRKGEVHALLGENGAGKTTLMSILYGLQRPDAGEIYRSGKRVTLRSPSDAIALGIGMVHQHFMLVPVFTVAENILLGAEVTGRFGVLDAKRARAEVRSLSERYGLEVDPDARIEDLPVGVQQRVEILKALYRNAEILILDEPTAVLTPQETEELFRVIRGLTAQGVSVVIISHKLKELLAVADRVTVMRAGRVVGATTIAETSEQGLATMMVGREVRLVVDRAPAEAGDDVLRVEGLHVSDARGVEAVRGVSFAVRAGEILGLAGVQGNGQTELAEALTGLRAPKSGRVLLGGRDVTGAPPRALIHAGLSHIPEDRQRHGLVASYPLADNLVLCTYDQPPFARRGVRDEREVRAKADALVKQFDVRPAKPEVAAATLSGGNQQKVIIARELSRPLSLLVANQPTRGLDVGSIEYIHKAVVSARDKGAAVLLVSAEVEEILGLSDRIAVMYRGELVAIVDASEATKEKLGLLMAGSRPEDMGAAEAKAAPG